jgi:hypothetical protein
LWHADIWFVLSFTIDGYQRAAAVDAKYAAHPSGIVCCWCQLQRILQAPIGPDSLAIQSHTLNTDIAPLTDDQLQLTVSRQIG